MKSWFSFALFVLFLASCSPVATPAPPVPSPFPVELTPWSSPTPAPTPAAAQPVEVTAQPLPTPTPRTHIMAKGEDMGMLSLKYGVPLAEILAANPDLDPHMLSIGQAVVIPFPEDETSSDAAPAAQPAEAGVTIHPPRCQLTTGGGLTCLAAVANQQDTPVENLSLTFTLLDGSGGEAASQVVYAPLNLLAGKAAMPFAANFPGPLPEPWSVRADLAGALPDPNTGERYLNHTLENRAAEIALDGLSARVSGQVRLAEDQADAATAWVLAVGYNAAGDVVCYRRWEDTAGIEPGQSRAFDFTLYTSGEKIVRVEYLSEVRP